MAGDRPRFLNDMPKIADRASEITGSSNPVRNRGGDCLDFDAFSVRRLTSQGKKTKRNKMETTTKRYPRNENVKTNRVAKYMPAPSNFDSAIMSCKIGDPEIRVDSPYFRIGLKYG